MPRQSTVCINLNNDKQISDHLPSLQIVPRQPDERLNSRMKLLRGSTMLFVDF